MPDDPDVARIRLPSVGSSNRRRFGDVWLARWLWKYVGLDEIVDRHVPQGKETIGPADMVAIEVINRLCDPCATRAGRALVRRHRLWKTCLVSPTAP